MRIATLTLLLCATLLAACGGKTVTCGKDTREENGQCVAATLATCPAGQALVGSQCVPVCGAGTLYADGKCTVADAACGPGTTLVGDECRMVDPLAAVTVHEAAEPNESPANAAHFELPAEGAPAVVLGGTVAATQDPHGDVDGFVFHAEAGAHVRIVATAVGAPTVGLLVQPADHPGTLQRYVVDTSARGATRELVLPTAGDWALEVTEGTNLAPFRSPVTRGGPDFTYTVAVSRLPRLTPAPLADTGAHGTFGAPQVFSVPGNGSAAGLLRVDLTTPDGELPLDGLRALWATTTDGTLLLDAADTLSTSGTIRPMSTARLVVPPEGALLGVDEVISFGPAAPWQLALAPEPVKEITIPFSGAGDLSNGGSQIFAFDVPANVALTVSASDIGYDADFAMELRDSHFRLLGRTTGLDFADLTRFIPGGQEGRYFLVCLDTTYDPEKFDLGFQLDIGGSDVTQLGSIDVPADASGNGATTAAYEKTYFAATAKADGLLTARATATSGHGVTLYALNDDFSALTSVHGSTGQAQVNELVVHAGQDLLFAVSTDQATDVLLELETETATIIPEREPNDATATAQPLAASPGAPLFVAATFASDSDADVYQLVVPGPGPLEVTLETKPGMAGGTPDTFLKLLDAQGQTIDSDDDGGAGSLSLLSRTGSDALAPGTYFVKVSLYASYSSPARDYVLAVKLNAPTP